LNGLDDIGQTLEYHAEIDRFESERRQTHHWLPPITVA
jgi:hypothetical protein